MYKLKLTIGIVLLSLFSHFSIQAQIKIGYTNAELILAYMPETQAMESSLTTFQKKLAEKLQAKQTFAQDKFTTYSEQMQNGQLSPVEQSTAEKELQQLESDLKKLASESDQQLLAKRQEMLDPIIIKLQKAIDETASENGYTYVLNQSSGGGVTTLLYGPEEDDLTKRIFKKLDISIPGK